MYCCSSRLTVCQDDGGRELTRLFLNLFTFWKASQVTSTLCAAHLEHLRHYVHSMFWCDRSASDDSKGAGDRCMSPLQSGLQPGSFPPHSSQANTNMACLMSDLANVHNFESGWLRAWPPALPKFLTEIFRQWCNGHYMMQGRNNCDTYHVSQRIYCTHVLQHLWLKSDQGWFGQASAWMACWTLSKSCISLVTTEGWCVWTTEL